MRSVVALCFVKLAVFATLVSAARKLPDYVQLCHKSDPDFDGCLKKSIESLRSRLGRGIPQMYIPGYEPLVIPGLNIDRTTESLEINAQIENLKVTGGSKFIIENLKTNLDGLGLHVGLLLPELQFSADYDVNGRLLVVPLNGKGSVEGTLKNVRSVLDIKGKLVERKNKKYIQVADFKSDIQVGDSKFNFRGPKSTSQQAISGVAEDFIEENKVQVNQLVKPIVEDTVNELFREITNRVLQSFPYDVIVPE